MIQKPFYSVEELCEAFGEPPEKIRDALVAEGVGFIYRGAPADLSAWESAVKTWMDNDGRENVLLIGGHNYDPHPREVIVGTARMPASWISKLSPSVGAGGSKLDAIIDSRQTDPQRRMNRLRELGGTVRFRHGKWTFLGIGRLVKSELAESRPRSSEKTIREDLCTAAEDEKTAKREGRPSPFPS